jgi:anti-anti-sigma factor
MGAFLHFRREIRASLEDAEAVGLGLREFLRAGKVSDKDLFALELLAREALSNAVRHGCREDASLGVRFRCRLGPRTAVIRVADDGPGFDWKADLERPPDDEATHGRGLALFTLYSSRMLYNAGGNQILLIRNLPEPTMTLDDASLEGTRAVLRPGDLTSGTVEQAREKLKALLKGGAKDLTVDLAGVQMVDSMGIGLLIQANNSLAKAGGGLTVINASAELLDLFRSMRLDKRFTIQA